MGVSILYNILSRDPWVPKTRTYCNWGSNTRQLPCLYCTWTTWINPPALITGFLSHPVTLKPRDLTTIKPVVRLLIVKTGFQDLCPKRRGIFGPLFIGLQTHPWLETVLNNKDQLLQMMQQPVEQLRDIFCDSSKFAWNENVAKNLDWKSDEGDKRKKLRMKITTQTERRYK